MRRNAFTLVELVVVVLVMGIIAAIGVPKVLNKGEDAEKEMLRANLDAFQDAIEYYYAENACYPETIDATLFRGNRLPQHPSWDNPKALIEVVNEPLMLNPKDPTLYDESGGAYWYNQAEGIVRARVPPQANDVLTTVLYNQVNGINESRNLR